MTETERKEHRALRWDGSVTAGNLLTAAVLVVGMIWWGAKMEGRIERAEERQKNFETLVSQYRLEDRQSEQAAFSDLRSSLRRIEDYLLRGSAPQPGR